MSHKLFMTADDVMAVIPVGRTKAYRIIRELDEELSARGYYTIRGLVNRRYFMEKFGFEEAEDHPAKEA